MRKRAETLNASTSCFSSLQQWSSTSSPPTSISLHPATPNSGPKPYIESVSTPSKVPSLYGECGKYAKYKTPGMIYSCGYCFRTPLSWWATLSWSLSYISPSAKTFPITPKFPTTNSPALSQILSQCTFNFTSPHFSWLSSHKLAILLLELWTAETVRIRTLWPMRNCNNKFSKKSMPTVYLSMLMSWPIRNARFAKANSPKTKFL